MAHLATQHVVVDLGDAVEEDLPDIHAVTRIDEEGERDLAGLGVRGRHRVDLGERVALEAEPVLDEFLGGRDLLLRESVARLDQQIVPQLCLRHDEGARKLDLADLEDIALGDVHRDEDIVLLGRYRHLRRVDVEVGVTAIHVIRAQFL